METSYLCAYCGEANDLFVDPAGGSEQEYIEDCQVCCQPNSLVIVLLPNGNVAVSARRENE